MAKTVVCNLPIPMRRAAASSHSGLFAVEIFDDVDGTAKRREAFLCCAAVTLSGFYVFFDGSYDERHGALLTSV